MAVQGGIVLTKTACVDLLSLAVSRPGLFVLMHKHYKSHLNVAQHTVAAPRTTGECRVRRFDILGASLLCAVSTLCSAALPWLWGGSLSAAGKVAR